MSTEQPTPVLDDYSVVQTFDTRNMLRLINELPEQCETALGIGRSFTAQEFTELPNVIFIAGASDAAVATSMAMQAVCESVEIPVIGDCSGQLPKCVGENALVFIVDYSGNSPVSVRAYKEARQRGSRVVCITSGGKLREVASKDETPTVKIPPGQPARTAVGYLFVPLVALFELFGFASGLVEKLSFGIRLMKNVREALRFENPTSRNIAKQTAQALSGKQVIIYGARDYRAPLLVRWKSQINTNSKAPAFAGLFPDVAEGEICGWQNAGDRADNTALVFLRDPQDRSEVAEGMAAAAEVLENFRPVSVEIRGSTTVEKLLHGVYVADYVSYYLALLGEVNPTTTELVSRVESVLAGEQPPEEPSEATPPADTET